MTVCIVSFRYKTLGNDWIKSSYPNVDFIVNATMTDTSGDGGWEEWEDVGKLDEENETLDERHLISHVGDLGL